MPGPDPKIFEADAQLLRDCLKGKSDKEQGIINITLKYTKRDRQGLKEIYKTCFGRDLQEDFQKELGGNFRETIIGLYDSPTVFDAKCLYKAMKGIGTDEDAIINILTSRPNAHRYMLKQRYTALIGRDLIKDLKDELSGKFEDVCLALLESPYELDCRCLHEAMERLGTNESTLIEIIATRPAHQLYQDKSLFHQLYGKDLVTYIHSETSGHFRTILEAMLQCQRHENNYPINATELQSEAQRLYKAGAARWGTDESVFTQIFTTRSPAEIATIAQYYQQIAGVDLYTSIKKEFSGNVETLLKAIFEASINPPQYFATRIRDALEGAGTKDKQLIRIIVSRAEIDLKLIKQAYFKIYNRDMVTDIRTDTQGDYKKILSELCNKW